MKLRSCRVMGNFQQSELCPIASGRQTTFTARIDILLLNAGIEPFSGQQLTADGYEPSLNVSNALLYRVNMMPNPFFIARFQVNNLCSSLFALRLLPIMLRTADMHHASPRIVVDSSDLRVHYLSNLDKDVYDSPKGLVKFGKL